MKKTSVIASKVEDIHSLRVHPVPTMPLPVAKAVRVNRRVVLLTADGQLYATGIHAGYSYDSDYTYSEVREITEGAWRLGAITKAAYQQDKTYREEQHRLRSQKWDAELMLEKADALGIKLTAAQQAKLAKLKGKTEAAL